MAKKTPEQIASAPQATAGGAFGIRAAYLKGDLHKGSSLWVNRIAPEQAAWADHLGFADFDSMPISHQKLVRVLIAEELLVEHYNPNKENPAGVREIRSSLNALTRLLLVLSGMKAQPKGEKVADFVARKYAAHG